MMNFSKVVALGATIAVSMAVRVVSAQDDLDDLLKQLDTETAQPADAAKDSAQTQAVVEQPAAEATPVAEAAPVADGVAGEKVEEKAPAAVAETPAVAETAPAVEEAPAVEASPVVEAAPAVAEVPAKPAVEEPKANDSFNLIDAVAAEASEKPAVAIKAQPAEAAGANPDAELISNLVSTERLRRQSLDNVAKREISLARESMKNGQYSDAVGHYGSAVKLLNDSASSKNLKRECEQGISEGFYRMALQKDAFGDREEALKLMDSANDRHHPKARRMLEMWKAEAGNVKEDGKIQENIHRMNEDDYKAKRENIRRHLRRSRQYLSVRDIEKSLEECEIVLSIDPYNQEAIRLRDSIERKRTVILQQERVVAREGMIADVDEAWRPVYAVNAEQLQNTSAETTKAATGDDPERTQEQDIERRMMEMRLPTISFKPPATIMDAVGFFRQASIDYDRPDIPIEKRGFNFILKTPQPIKAAAEEVASDDFASNSDTTEAAPANGLDPIPTITASDISFFEALKLVCDSVNYKFIVRGPVVMVMHKDMSTAELLSRKYNVPEAFVERVNTASEEIKTMGGFGGSKASTATDEADGEGRDWKAFFHEMGVKWPEGSSIKHIKALGKLYVRNTRENLAEFEKVLDELGGQTQLIEIETRFVEVSQEDLNSLGFEWILNSNYALDFGNGLDKVLGVKKGGYTEGWTTTRTDGLVPNAGGMGYSEGQIVTTSGTGEQIWSRADMKGNSLGQGKLGIDAFGGSSSYKNGNRYLSTQNNPISGQSGSTPDQFMRVNAFLGSADLSMILHMLSQRTDTDLLSAPKVVTKSGENAVIKVVTEYIYPQDYDVQLQSSSSSSSGGSNGGSQSAILAVVEPQNFTMREVGVILDVTPTYSEANGGTIDLELKPEVVDEPTWKNYGMRIPFTGNSASGTLPDIGNIFTGMSTALNQIGATLGASDKEELSKQVVSAATTAVGNLSTSSSDNMTYYDAPMEQPFFHKRAIDSKVSITPGATVVMGGLITEARKAMDDKIPFLGDLPYIGRLFRSHAEQTVKRNLLIFVTGRLITPSGRELRTDTKDMDSAEVAPAPKAE